MCKSVKAIAIQMCVENMFPLDVNSIKWQLKSSRITEEKDVYIIFIDCELRRSFFDILRSFILKETIGLGCFSSYEFVFDENKTVVEIEAGIRFQLLESLGKFSKVLKKNE
ncbi:MAG: hypothetical protein F6K54_32630 [Okeania sp. SIO3B5]|uniref:hypothetical protein n=1 Tax=Okeania sp. SIO3B5 TaxID=2607811 RepID=UPI0013FF83F7|nr:hypothetical protein [Okeania sp. SIO3B5]NEO57408.1 hypothetical protein [Okeania sp. SIO3B5]